jgi:hypothetical protein
MHAEVLTVRGGVQLRLARRDCHPIKPDCLAVRHGHNLFRSDPPPDSSDMRLISSPVPNGHLGSHAAKS